MFFLDNKKYILYKFWNSWIIYNYVLFLKAKIWPPRLEQTFLWPIILTTKLHVGRRYVLILINKLFRIDTYIL